jgi:hypothetical protein
VTMSHSKEEYFNCILHAFTAISVNFITTTENFRLYECDYPLNIVHVKYKFMQLWINEK